MKNLKGQNLRDSFSTTWLSQKKAIVFIIIISTYLIGYLYLKNRELNSQLKEGSNSIPGTPLSQSPSPSLRSATPGETTDWKTYTDPDRKYSFSYPLNISGTNNPVEVQETRTSAYLIIPETEGLLYGVKKFTSTTARSVYQEDKQGYGSEKTGDLKITTVNGFPGYEVTIAPSILPVKILYLARNADVYRIEFNYQNDIGNQILSTFKFLDSAGSSEIVNFYSFSGKLALNGYLTTLERSCAFNEDSSCKVKLAVFTVLTADNPQFNSFLKDLAGNAFAINDGIVLGCIDEAKRQINSSNDADTGEVENLISDGQYGLLVGSSPGNPINLSVEKPRLTSGRGAPDCYSHFRNFKVY